MSSHAYIFMSPTLPYRYKIGISNKPSKRKKQLDRVGVFQVLALPCLDAKQLEAFCHFVLSPLNTKVKGNGGTEWFWTLNLFTAAALFFYKGEFDYTLFIILLFPLPIDGLILFVLVWAFQLFFLFAVVFALMYLSTYYE
jgi:hypothetical protein